MAYVIAEPCIGEKDNSCVEVCPVDCFYVANPSGDPVDPEQRRRVDAALVGAMRPATEADTPV